MVKFALPSMTPSAGEHGDVSEARGSGGCQWPPGGVPPSGGPQRSEPAPKPYGFLKTYGLRMRLVTRCDTGVNY